MGALDRIISCESVKACYGWKKKKKCRTKRLFFFILFLYFFVRRVKDRQARAVGLSLPDDLDTAPNIVLFVETSESFHVDGGSIDEPCKQHFELRPLSPSPRARARPPSRAVRSFVAHPMYIYDILRIWYIQMEKKKKPSDRWAAVFTRNMFPGAPVIVGKERLAAEGRSIQAVVVNNKVGTCIILRVSCHVTCTMWTSGSHPPRVAPLHTGVLSPW